jgi:hypothetical protein
VPIEVLLVNHIHARKVCHVVKENTGLNNPAQVTPSSFQNCPHVVENNILQQPVSIELGQNYSEFPHCLFLNGSLDNIPVLVGRNLARAENQAIGLDSLGLLDY